MAEASRRLNFTTEARNVLPMARNLARERGDAEVSTYHLLLALMETTPEIVTRYGLARGELIERLNRLAPEGPTLDAGDEPTSSPRAKEVISLAHQQMLSEGARRITTEHLFKGVVREKQGVAATALAVLGLTETNMADRARVVYAPPLDLQAIS